MLFLNNVVGAVNFGTHSPSTRFDYNAYEHGASWRYYSPTVQIMTRTFDEFRERTGHEKHGFLLDQAGSVGPGVAPPPGSPLIDKACLLPNVNDDFTGAGPDIGPYEFGQPLPHYGPRPTTAGSGTRKSNQKPGCYNESESREESAAGIQLRGCCRIMDENLNRRDFTKSTSTAVGGLLAGAFLGNAPSSGGDRQMPDRRLVLLGLNALARAHEFDYFVDGHRGAGMVAAHLLCVENDLDEQATARIVELVDLNWASSPLCRSFPDADADPAGIEKIGAALAEGGDVLRQVGHNAIFATLAIKAFRLLPSAATAQRIDGVCKMIRSFTPWRTWNRTATSIRRRWPTRKPHRGLSCAKPARRSIGSPGSGKASPATC